MKVKKIVIGLLVIIVVLLVAASRCGGKTNDIYTDITWPRSKLAELLPVPEYKKGRIISDSATYLSVDIANMSTKQYNTYVEACRDKGFNEDYFNSDDMFTADNPDGYSLSLYYNDKDKVISISLSAPKEEESSTPKPSETPTPTPEPAPVETPAPEPESTEPEESPEESKSEPADGIRPEFKEAMDSYLAFYEEYAEFMREYQKSDNTLGLLAEYADYMAKLSDWTEKWDALGNEEMSSEELKYYTDIQARVTKILIDVSGE